MKPIDVFYNPEAAEQSSEVALCVVSLLEGVPVSSAMAALFSSFVAISQQANFDAGYEFEAMLSALEARQTATHRGSGSLH